MVEKIKNILNWLDQYRLKGVTIVVFVLLVLFILVDNGVMPLLVRLGQGDPVPDLKGISLAEAEKILDDHGFKSVLEGEKYDRTYPPGYIVSQNPKANSIVKKGRRIYMITSMGEELIKVPRMVGRSERDANFIISSAQLQLDHVSFEHSSYYPEGVVTEQSIEENKEVKLGTPISIIISLGQFPDRFLIPDLQGKDLEGAIKRIRKAGLRLGEVTYQLEPNLLPNTVISQSIEPFQEVSIGTIINLVVSSIPDETVIPEETTSN
jgi:serine/threonine-protein kinase